MNIKNATKYVTFLTDNINQLERLFSENDYVYKTTEKHNKSKSVKTEENEIKEIQYNKDKLDIDLNKVSYIIKDLMDEKLKIVNAIAKAKQNNKIQFKTVCGDEIDLDTAIQHNQNKRCFLQTLFTTKNYRSEQEIKTGIGYMINNDGEQVSYRYEVEVDRQINYDRNKIIEMHKSLSKECDKLSELIDELMTKDIIDIETKFSVHDDLEYRISNYLLNV